MTATVDPYPVTPEKLFPPLHTSGALILSSPQKLPPRSGVSLSVIPSNVSKALLLLESRFSDHDRRELLYQLNLLFPPPTAPEAPPPPAPLLEEDATPSCVPTLPGIFVTILACSSRNIRSSLLSIFLKSVRSLPFTRNAVPTTGHHPGTYFCNSNAMLKLFSAPEAQAHDQAQAQLSSEPEAAPNV